MLRRNPTGHMPEVSETAFIDPTAIICGKVIIEDNVFIGPYAVIRADEVNELDEYIKGGKDNQHQQLREAYHHIPKPQARKIRDYLACILEDAVRYSDDKRRGRKRRSK